MINFLLFILLSTGAGWLAGRLLKGRGFGVVGDMLIGVLGASVGFFLFRGLSIFFAESGLIGSLMVSAIVISALSFLSRRLKKSDKQESYDVPKPNEI